MVTPKGSISTEGETLQVSVLPYRCSICPLLVTRHVNPVIKFLPHKLHVCGRNLITGLTSAWSVSPSVDMLPFSVTIPATVPHRSEIPEGLVNYPVLTPLVLKHGKNVAEPTSVTSQGKDMMRKKYLIYWLVYNAGTWEGLTPSVKVTRLKEQRKVVLVWEK